MDKMIKNEFKVNLENCYKNNFRNDVQKAVKFYLEQGDDFKYCIGDYGGFVLYPHALNPFLKIMEIMGESGNFIIIPGFDQDNNNRDVPNKPAYIIIKMGKSASKICKIISNEELFIE